MRDLEGKWILVTGGSRGIGEAIVRSVAGAGAGVLLHYASRRDRAERIRDVIGGDICRLIQADLSQADGAARLWREATELAPRIDVLVNNAGIYEPAPVEAPDEAWRGTWRASCR
jgi:NAD(P)-dependent dehydrogenase (short-subunit alcohol dehydrogenase family)